MNKEIVSNQQGIALIALFIMGSSLVLPTGLEAGRDLWLAILLAIVAAFALYAMYARLLVLFPNQDIFQILEMVCGRWIGKILSLAYTWFAFYLGSMVLRNFGEYLRAVGLTETPMIIPVITLTFLCLWGAREGLEVLGRWSAFFLNMSLVLTVVTVLLMMNMFDLDNIIPVLYNGYRPLLNGVWDVLAFPLTEVIIVLAFLIQVPGRNSVYKTYWGGLVIGGVILFLSALSEILVLGIDVYSSTYFPAHIAVSLVRVGDFLQRLEIIPAVSFLTGGFIKISACILAASRGVARVCNCSDYRFIVTPLALLMVNLSYFMYDDIVEMIQFSAVNWKYYALPFQIIIPVLVLVVAEIRTRFGHGVKNL